MNNWLYVYYAWCLKCISESQTTPIKIKGDRQNENVKSFQK